MFTLKISTANASFDDGETYAVASILECVASSLRSYHPISRNSVTIGQPIRDANGNTVGKWELK